MLIGVQTLGCKVNQFETQLLSESLESKGFEIAENVKNAPLYLINTCTVTSRASYQCRQTIRKILKNNENSKIIVTGCYAQNDPAAIQEISENIIIIDNFYKDTLPELIEKNYLTSKTGKISEKKEFTPYLLKNPPFNRTRAYLKIQDGCDSFCSYCIVPYTRGRSRSLKPEHITLQLEQYRTNGIKEVILTGIHIGQYGKDINYTFFDLLKLIIPGFPEIRFRVSSIEVNEISNEFIKWTANQENFCPHFHIPLQSGSDNILKRMNRHYNRDFFANVIREINLNLPFACIGTDIMVGFCGEDITDFYDSYNLIKDLPVSYLHVFPFSKRKGTPAFNFKADISKEEKEQRVKILLSLSKEKKSIFYNKNINKIVKCLIEKKDEKTGYYSGFTENYIPVHIKNNQSLSLCLENQLKEVKICRIKDDKVLAEIIGINTDC